MNGKEFEDNSFKFLEFIHLQNTCKSSQNDNLNVHTSVFRRKRIKKKN